MPKGDKLTDKQHAVGAMLVSMYIKIYYVSLWQRKFGIARAALHGIDDMTPGAYFTEENDRWFTKALKLVKWLLLPENRELRRGTRLGERSTKIYHLWRMAVLERDNYTCQEQTCRVKENLIVHHMKSYKDYPSKRVDFDNGITLCRQCHKDTHRL